MIIIHCSAVRPDRTSSVEEIGVWHKALGWDGCGYHYVVRRDGTVETGRAEARQGAHCYGWNRQSIGVCYEGGLDSQGRPADTRTPEQKHALLNLVKELKTRYPNASIHGHNEFARKSCPCFDVHAEYGEL